RTVIARETAETLVDHDPPLLATTIGQRVAFAESAQTGRLVSETDGGERAMREIATLAAEIDGLRVGRARA
ncbi:MAG: cobyrinic acid a,c-diamide synthase, partial [Novosphingobium sp.]|nr:cobyrinic acid a,c-diamide synthase [Novosphingobium sp.]